jgi:hypothetical protein
MFQLNYVAVLAFIATAMCWSLAVVLFRVGEVGSVARRLALLLLVEGIALVSTGFIDSVLSQSVRDASGYASWIQAEIIIHTIGDCLMLILYPPFLAAALQTRLVRPFASAKVMTGVAVLTIAATVMAVAIPADFAPVPLYLMLCALFGFALVASVQAWLESAGSARDRARSFALAFGIRDVCWGIVYGGGIWLALSGDYAVVEADATSPIYLLYALGTLFAVPLIAYGILRTQLFDIDLKIQWTIKQSTLAAIFVVVVYLVSEGADRFLSEELGNWAGLLASALVVFFLTPLQRFAERVASVAMPNTENTPEYATYRKMQVYESSFADALLGGISDKERVLLDTLRDTLGISLTDAAMLETDLLEAYAT